MWYVVAVVLFTAWTAVAFYGIVALGQTQDPAWLAAVSTYLVICTIGICGHLYVSKCQRQSALP